MIARIALMVVGGLGLVLGVLGCGGDAKPLPPDPTTPIAIRAVQNGPMPSELTVHYVDRRCRDIEIEPEESARRVVLTVQRSTDAPCSGARAARSFSVPLERPLGSRRVVDGRSKRVLGVATCQRPGSVSAAIRKSICRVQRRKG